MQKSNGDLAVCGFKERKISANGQVEDLSRVFCPKEVIVIEDMKILSADGLTATLSEKEYRTHGKTKKPISKVYLIDFDVDATDREVEFSFVFEA